MAEDLPSQAPVVIIGGGIIGVSVLYHLAHRGVPAVLIERKRLASGTTWHAAGIVGQLRDSTAQTELGKYTVKLFQDLEIETGQATGYKQNGTINIALSNVRHEQLLRNHDHAARMGIPSYVLTPKQVQEHWPDIKIADVVSGFYVPSNGQVNPLDVTTALAKGARMKGAKIFENTKVQRLDIANGCVRAVETERGSIATSQVLIAGGMWSHQFAKQHGITVPLHASEHFYIVTEPIHGLPPNRPILNIVEERTYWKEDAGKLLIGGFEAQGKTYGQRGIPETFEFDELPFDMDHVAPEMQRMFARMPALENIGIQTFFNGPESFTPDGRPYLGPAPEVKGVFVATGMNSNGILNSGGVGLTMAQWMIDGRPGSSMLPLLAVRAQPFQANTKYNRERAAESVGFHYGLAWSGRQVHSTRGVRRVPLHPQLINAGAVMAERIGWEVPMYYDAKNPHWSTDASLRRKPWSKKVKEESLAAKDSVVVLDQSMYAKLIVQGPDAVHALNYVCGAQMDVKIGTSVYTQFLNIVGGIEADITVTRIDEHVFFIISGHPSQTRDLHWIKTHAQKNWRFEVFDATSAYSLLTIHGPKSRELLEGLTDDDVSNTAFPFGDAKQLDVAYARAWVIRRSFLGELGYEILLPTEFTSSVYEAVLEAGKPLGLKHMGMFAMNACRLEKGFRHFGHDIAEDDTPFESGLGFAVSMDKSDFLGKQALERLQREQAPSYKSRLVSISVPGLDTTEGPYLIHNEPVWKNGAIVGHVTSGDYGFRLNSMVGIAALDNDSGVSSRWLEEGGFKVQVCGTLYEANVQLKPFYDPDGTRMRG